MAVIPVNPYLFLVKLCGTWRHSDAICGRSLEYNPRPAGGQKATFVFFFSEIASEELGVADPLHGRAGLVKAGSAAPTKSDRGQVAPHCLPCWIWPVTSSVTSSSNFWPCTGCSRTGLSNGVWNLEIGPVVLEISGDPPSHRKCY